MQTITEENNKMVALFMGAKIIPAIGNLNRDIHFEDRTRFRNLHVYNAEMLEYHSSWD